MLTTSHSSPRTMADSLLSLTELMPELSLDVAEDADNTDNYLYTWFLPEALQQPLQAALNLPLVFTQVDETIDYIALTKANFPPLQVGPFFIARNAESTPKSLIGLEIMPNRAFGSGEHATTTGCLLGYTHLIEEKHKFETGLDFGAGSGILAIAAAKWQKTPFLCLDIDPPSVEINARNAALNGVESLITCDVAEIPPFAQFNLVFANILLQPLLDLAEPLAACLAPGGSLILSGFTEDQAEQIERMYKSLGLKPAWQHRQQGWVAQIWQHA